MRAEQSRFIASLKGKNEGDTSEEGKLNLEDLASEEIETSCSLCHDSHSQSPLCFLVFLQVMFHLILFCLQCCAYGFQIRLKLMKHLWSRV